jgi:hypothetical protein
MHRWAVQKLTRLPLARLRRGDPRPLLALSADGGRALPVPRWALMGRGLSQRTIGFDRRLELAG